MESQISINLVVEVRNISKYHRNVHTIPARMRLTLRLNHDTMPLSLRPPPWPGDAPAGGPLPIAECLASPDMYTWSHKMTSKEQGSRGWTCQGKLKITNVSKEPLLLDPHLDVSAGTNSPDPWIPGTATEGDQCHGR